MKNIPISSTNASRVITAKSVHSNATTLAVRVTLSANRAWIGNHGVQRINNGKATEFGKGGLGTYHFSECLSWPQYDCRLHIFALKSSVHRTITFHDEIHRVADGSLPDHQREWRCKLRVHFEQNRRHKLVGALLEEPITTPVRY